MSEVDIRRENAVKYFNGDELAAEVWLSKYALPKEKSPKDSINRYVKEIYRIELKYPNPMSYEDIETLLSEYKYFILGGSSMYGIGNNNSLSTLSNCYVLGNEVDSYGGILAMDQDLVQAMKRRGGVGLDLSHLRPKKAVVNNAAKTSTGAVSFMERFSNTTLEVAQEGRRGALMLTLDINHPDIEDFITAKDDLTKITGANISVKITDEFMEAVEKDEDFELYFNKFLDKKVSESMQSPLGGQHIRIKIKARKLWDKLIHQAWKSAEPGVLFWDRVIENSPADIYAEHGFKTTSTNPCSELPLSKLDSCRLGSLNIFNYIEEPFTKDAFIDIAKLRSHAIKAQRIMDDVVDLEQEKVQAIIDSIRKSEEDVNIRAHELWLWTRVLKVLVTGRRTGLGLTGLADAGAALALTYGSKEFIKFAEEVQKVITLSSYKSSIILAKERGAFPIFNLEMEKDHPFLSKVINKDNLGNAYLTYKHFGRRNIANLTIAPNGSISILGRVSSGIEPIFMLAYTRRRRVDSDTKNAYKDERGDYWINYRVLHPRYEQWRNITSNTKIEESPYYKSTANEIEALSKVRMQGLMQEWIDHSISVTHNLPKTATEKDVSDLYFTAWKLGCKGGTVYRDGSRHGILISEEPKERFIQNDNAPKRPKELIAEAIAVTVKGEKFTVVVGLMEDKPYEVFAYKGNGLSGRGIVKKQKKGEYLFIQDNKKEVITNDLTDEQEALTRGYSYALRHGSPIDFGVEQLNKTKGDLTSFSKAMARALGRFTTVRESTEACPDCGHKLVYQSGCLECSRCSYSKC